MRHVRRAAIWTLGHKSKKADESRCVCRWRVLCPNISKFDQECRMSRVFRDLLSHLDLTAATQQPAAATQQHCCWQCCCCYAAAVRLHRLLGCLAAWLLHRLLGSSTVRWRGQTSDKQTNKHPGTTIRLTLCERDATDTHRYARTLIALLRVAK